MLILDTFEHKRSFWDQNHRGCWNTGCDWDTSAVSWCLYSPGECFLGETEIAESWLEMEREGSENICPCRTWTNPLSLYIRLLTVEN